MVIEMSFACDDHVIKGQTELLRLDGRDVDSIQFLDRVAWYKVYKSFQSRLRRQSLTIAYFVASLLICLCH
jgi:hypothetical protein